MGKLRLGGGAAHRGAIARVHLFLPHGSPLTISTAHHTAEDTEALLGAPQRTGAGSVGVPVSKQLVGVTETPLSSANPLSMPPQVLEAKEQGI